MYSSINIIVLGSSFAGLGVSHYILRHIIPSAAKDTGKKYKLMIISPSTHLLWVVGTPRAISRPELIVKASMPFADAFKQYGDLYEHLQEEATALDCSTKLITVEEVSGKRVQVAYDSLIIATGTKSNSPLWSLHGPHTITLNALGDTNSAISKAKTIVIAGGGPTGIEVAGEIAYHWHGKDLTLFSGSTRLLSNLSHERVGMSAESQMRKLKVKTVHMTKIISVSKLGGGNTMLKLNNGSTMEVDLYIDATGATPNTSFLPADWLNNSGCVITNAETLRVTAAPAGIYAMGDVASYSKRNIFDVHRAVAPLGYSLWADLTKNCDVQTPLVERIYKQDPRDFQFVPIGPKGGVGIAFGFSVPSFLVWAAKSRTFQFDNLSGYVKGVSYINIDISSFPS